VRSGRKVPERPAGGGWRASFKHAAMGVEYLRAHPKMVPSYLMLLTLFATLYLLNTLLAPYAANVLEVGPAGLGLLRTAPAIGSFLAALAIARYPVRRRAGPTLFVVVAGFGACMVVFGLSRQMWLSMLALALGGAFDLVSVVLRSTILPLVTPDEVRGRVNAVEMVFISASNELGAFESGVAAALIGAVPAVVIGGVATVVVAGAWWKLFPSLARVDRLDELRPVAVEPG
jgi:predicted MFS family arabinose efflux permease